MNNRNYRLFLYKPAAGNFIVDSQEYRNEFFGELKADNVIADIKLQDISILSFSLPENILGEINTRIDDVLDNYIVELWYGKLEGTLGADFFPQLGNRVRFIITQSKLDYSDGIKKYTYQANSIEHVLEFKQIFNWPGIKVKDYYRTIRYDKTNENFIEVESTGAPAYTISTSTNANGTKYITVPTTFGLTANAPESFEIFLYQYRRNTDDTLNSENSIIQFDQDVNNAAFKEGFYVPVYSGTKVTSLQIAIPDNISDFGLSNPDAIFEIFLYDNPLKRPLTVVTETTVDNSQEDQLIETAQTVTTIFRIDLLATQNSNILKKSSSGSAANFYFKKLEVGQKIRSSGSGLVDGTVITDIDQVNSTVTVSNNFTLSGTDRRRNFRVSSENIVNITPPPPPAQPTIQYSFSSQLIYSINGLKLEHILLGTQSTRDGSNNIDNSVLNIDGILYNTGFTIGTIDSSIADKFRSNIELNNITLYEAIKTLAETFDSIAIFDTINKTISFYPDKNEEVFTNNGLIITKENYLKNISNDINASKIITKAYAAGKNNLGIQLINPTGSAAWEDYSYFLDTWYVKFDKNNLLSISADPTAGIAFSSFPQGTFARWIDSTEALKIAKWQYTRDYFHSLLLGEFTSPIASHQTRYSNLYNLRNTEIANFVKEETKYFEIKAIEYKYKAMYELYLKNNKNSESPTPESLQLETDFKKKYDDAIAVSAIELAKINKLHYELYGTRLDGTLAVEGDPDFTELDTASVDSIATKFAEIRSFLNKESGQNIDLEKLKIFEKEAVMTDSKLDNELELIEALQEFVKENCIPIVTIDLGVSDFLASYQSKVDWDKVKIGDIVNIYYPDFNIDTSAQLREISIDFQENTLNFIISTYRQYSQLPLTYIAKQIRSNYDNTTNKLLYEHDNNVHATTVTDRLNKKIQSKLNAAETAFNFGATSITGEASTSINGEGFVSRVIDVDPLLEVFIYENTKSLQIIDGTLIASQQKTGYKSEVEVSGDNGFVIRKYFDNGTSQRQVYIDTNGNAVFAGTLEVGSDAYNQVVNLAGAGSTVYSAANQANLVDATSSANENDILFITESFTTIAPLTPKNYIKDEIYRFNGTSWDPDLDLTQKTTGSVGGWTIESTVIKSNNNFVTLNNTGWFGIKKISYTDSTAGAFLGLDTNDSDIAKFNVGDASNYMKWTGTMLEVVGDIGGQIGSISVGGNKVTIDSSGIKGNTGSGLEADNTFFLNASTGAGFIGGFLFDNQKLSTTNLKLVGGSTPYLSINQTTEGYLNPGAFLGIDSGLTKLSLNPEIVRTFTSTASSDLLTGGNTTNLNVGMGITSPVLSSGTQIIEIVDSTTVRMNTVALSNSTGSFTFSNGNFVFDGSKVQIGRFSLSDSGLEAIGVVRRTSGNPNPITYNVELDYNLMKIRASSPGPLGGSAYTSLDAFEFIAYDETKFPFPQLVRNSFAKYGSREIDLQVYRGTDTNVNNNILTIRPKNTTFSGFGLKYTTAEIPFLEGTSSFVLAKTTEVYSPDLLTTTAINLGSVYLEKGVYVIDMSLRYQKTSTLTSSLTLGFFVSTNSSLSTISGVFIYPPTPNSVATSAFIGSDSTGIPLVSFSAGRNSFTTNASNGIGSGTIRFTGTVWISEPLTFFVRGLTSITSTYYISNQGFLKLIKTDVQEV